jgi:hypothetical protein
VDPVSPNPTNLKKERLAKTQQTARFCTATQLQQETSLKQSSACCLLLDAVLFFNPEDESDMLLRNAH